MITRHVLITKIPGSRAPEAMCWKAVEWPGVAGVPGAQFVVELGFVGSKQKWTHLRAYGMIHLSTMSASIAAAKVHVLPGVWIIKGKTLVLLFRWLQKKELLYLHVYL